MKQKIIQLDGDFDEWAAVIKENDAHEVRQVEMERKHHMDK